MDMSCGLAVTGTICQLLATSTASSSTGATHASWEQQQGEYRWLQLHALSAHVINVPALAASLQKLLWL